MLGTPGFFNQVPVEFPVANYTLTLPSDHPLIALLDPTSPRHQPYREAGLIRLVQALQKLGRGGTIIDVGANVGDSCAIIHRLSTLPILCLEASDFFFPYLEQNISRHFADRAIARQAFVLAEPGDTPAGLYHVAGTAKAVDQPCSESGGALAMSEVLDLAGSTALLKVDVDGLDLGLVSAVLAHGQPRYPIYFELELIGQTLDQIRADGARAQMLFRQAAAAGYGNAYLWDDAGRFYGRLDTGDAGALANVLNYMAHCRNRPVWGFDIALLHRDDAALIAELESGLAVNAVMPLR